MVTSGTAPKKKKSRMGRDPFELLGRGTGSSKDENDVLKLVGHGSGGAGPELAAASPAQPQKTAPVAVIGRPASGGQKAGEAPGRSYTTYLKKQTINKLEDFAYWNHRSPSSVVQDLLEAFLSRQGIIKPQPAGDKKLKVEFK